MTEPTEETAQVYADAHGRQYYLEGNRPVYLDQTTIGPGEIAFDPTKVVDEFGLSAGGWFKGHVQRSIYKNLTANPKSAQAFIEGIKAPEGTPLYEVQPVPKSYGANLNLFVRKRGSGGPWKPIDPSPSNWKDWLNDLTDLTVDAVSSFMVADAYVGGSAIGTIAGGPGAGLIGGAAAAALTTAGMETMRQAAGSIAGVPNNLDPEQARNMGFIAAAVPLTGGAVAAGARAYGPKVGGALADFAATIATIRPAAGMSGGQVMIAKAKDKLAGAWGAMPTLSEAARFIRQTLRPDNMPPFPEKIAKAQIIEQLSGPAGPKANIRPILDEIRKIGATPNVYEPPAKMPISPAVAKLNPQLAAQLGASQNIPDELADAISKNPRLPREMRELARRVGLIVQDHPEDQLPLNIQARVLDTVESFGRERGAWAEKNLGSAPAKEVVRPVQAAVHKIREELLRRIEPIHPDIRDIFDKVDDKTREYYVLSDAFGLNLTNAAEGEAKAGRTIQALYEGEDAFRRTLRDQEIRFGYAPGTLTEIARRYHIGQGINPATHGVPKVFPRAAFSGLPLGFGAGGVLGTMTGLGFGPGATAGIIMSSPKMALGATKALIMGAERLGRLPIPPMASAATVGMTPALVRSTSQESAPVTKPKANPTRLY